MKRRYRFADPLNLDPSFAKRFRVVQALVPVKLAQQLEFLVNKPLRNGIDCDNRVQVATLVVRPTENKDSVFDTLNARVMIQTECDSLGLIGDFHNFEQTCIRNMLTAQSLCVTFLMGIRPKMGRDDSWWVDVDEDTRKRVRSPPESSVHRAFVKHELAEKQCIQLIFAFLL